MRGMYAYAYARNGCLKCTPVPVFMYYAYSTSPEALEPGVAPGATTGSMNSRV